VGAGEQAVFAGLVVTGESRTVLIRGIGPALEQFGVANALPDPQIALFGRAGQTAPVSSNDDWSDNALPGVFEAVGAFPLARGSKDAALVATLSPGNYTVQRSGQPGQTGVALVEIYEADLRADRILNLSTRAVVGSGVEATISGFTIAGLAPKRVLIRAVGPGLTAFE